MNRMTASFWTGGPEAYAKALRQQYQSLLGELRKRHKTADPSERTELESEIARTKAEYKSKLDSIDHLDF